MKQAQEMEQTLQAINPNAFLLFSLSERLPLAPSQLKLGNRNDDLLAVQGLQLKSGGGQAGADYHRGKALPKAPPPRRRWRPSSFWL